MSVFGKIILSLFIIAICLNLNAVTVKYDHKNPFEVVLDSICGLSWFFAFILSIVHLILKVWL